MGLFSDIAASAPSPTLGSSLIDISNAVQQYVVAPLAAFGIGGFVFNAEGEATADLQADITDHYTEDNTAVQDHIALHPKRVTLKGYVGELVYNTDNAGQSTLAKLAQKLTVINSYLPQLSAAATQAQQAISNPSSLSVSSVLSSASDIYSLVENVLGASGNMKNQQNAYSYFEALWQTGTLMGIQTPWKFLTNMAIERVTSLQPEGTIFVTDFAVTFKQIRPVSTATVAFSAGNTGTNITAPVAAAGTITMTDLPSPARSAIAAAQGAPTTQLGQTPGSTSLLNGLTSSLGLSGLTSFLPH